MAEALTLVATLFAFGELPAAMGWSGEVLLGPAPYVFVPIGPVGVSFGGGRSNQAMVGPELTRIRKTGIVSPPKDTPTGPMGTKT